MKHRVGDILKKHSRLEQLSLLLVVILFLTFSSAYAGVPRDESPVPYGNLAFQGNYFDISGWQATRTISKVYITGHYICFDNDIGKTWYEPPNQGVNANVHIILKYNGKWITSPWDYMGVGQTCKHSESVGGIPYSRWKPKHGEELYWYITGISRDSSGGVNQERTNIVRYDWEGDAGYPPPACDGPPVIDSFSATPNPVVSGETGLQGETKDYNVQLSWDISNADSAELVIGDGEKVQYSAKKDLQLLIDKTTTFTLYGKNDCTSEESYPTKTLKVIVRPASLPLLTSLLLYHPAVVNTLDIEEVSHDPLNIKMHGTVNPKFHAGTAVFEYGPTDTYGSVVDATPNNVTGGEVIPIYAIAENLAKGTLYHYRAKVMVRDRIILGKDKTFTTDNVPRVATDGVNYHESVASTVTLKGLINPNGATINTITFKYGEGIGNFDKEITGSALSSPGAITDQPSSVKVSGLTKGAKHQYKVCAQNILGPLQCSTPETFTTFDVPLVETTAIDYATVTGTNATLKGRVDPNRNETTVTFEWGDTTAYNSGSKLLSAGSGDEFKDISTTIDPLDSGTIYHYRITAFNSYGDAIEGADMTFETDGSPGVTTLAAENISSTEVKLSATIDPNGAETTVKFLYNGGGCTPEPTVWYNFVPALDEVVYSSPGETVAIVLGGRIAGAMYCYKAVAENGIGAPVDGAVVEFTQPL